MKNNTLLCLIIVTVIGISGCTQQLSEDISLMRVFGDNMVLQRNQEIIIQGKATPLRKVKVEFNNQEYETKAGKDSIWKTNIPPMNAGGTYELTVTGKDTSILLKNIMIGDVWIASGQSNMVWKIGYGIKNTEKELKEANYPEIRMFTVESDYNRTPLPDVNTGEWLVCSPDTAGYFSAVAYFFARHIHKEKKIPVGVIVSAIGGTTIKGWIAEDIVNKNKETIPVDVDTSAIFPEYDDEAWTEMNLPSHWENKGYTDYDGYAWFRKNIIIPEDFTGKNLQLHLGRIDDKDVTWFNAKRIGAGEPYNYLRNYPIDKKLIKKGENLIAVRVLDGSGKGGFWGPKEEMYLADDLGNKILDLSGKWKFNNTIKPQFPVDDIVPAQTGVMFNAMVNPFRVIPVKGIIWYQGEADVSIADLYEEKMKNLISSWRKKWGAPDLPFLYVQLPYYKEKTDSAVQLSSDWAKQREAQLSVLSVPYTGMAVTIDVGEAGDVHPRNKLPVGNRLALAARKIAYGEDITCSGPLYDSHVIHDDTVIISFKHTGESLTIHGDTLSGFALAGPDGTYYKAGAWIRNNNVYLISDKVSEPVSVRYGWADNPDCNLYNSEGLPASPFRTEKE
jgi:sialate O-acetylesterase